jgi:hypothetical protein
VSGSSRWPCVVEPHPGGEPAPHGVAIG